VNNKVEENYGLAQISWHLIINGDETRAYSGFYLYFNVK
jgi:hypothetical protein